MKAQVTKMENGITSTVATFATLAQARKSAVELQSQAMDAEERAIGREDLGHYAMMDAIEHAKNNPREQFVPEAARNAQRSRQRICQQARIVCADFCLCVRH